MTVSELLFKIKQSPTTISFTAVQTVIDQYYVFTPTAFTNGNLHNPANENLGSCKIFSFAQLHQLTVPETLACFGDYYFNDVLNYPEQNNHQNIRNFVKTGWSGICFANPALQEK